MDLASMAEELGLEEENVRQLILTFLDSTEQDLVLLARAFSGKDVEHVCGRSPHKRSRRQPGVAPHRRSSSEDRGEGALRDYRRSNCPDQIDSQPVGFDSSPNIIRRIEPWL
jgi:hypothetical protein